MADVKWRKFLAITAIMLSLLLISGSVYLQMRNKHHYGRLSHDNKAITFTSEEIKYVVQPMNTPKITISEGSSYDEGLTNSGDYTPQLHQPKRYHISEACMQCICETVTECKPVNCSPNKPCGIFHISQSYWFDGGRQLLEGDSTVIENNDALMEYLNCVNNPFCAARTVSAFMSKYARDCTRDNIIDCSDFVAIHVMGPNGCVKGNLAPNHERRMIGCFERFGLNISLRD